MSPSSGQIDRQLGTANQVDFLAVGSVPNVMVVDRDHIVREVFHEAVPFRNLKGRTSIHIQEPQNNRPYLSSKCEGCPRVRGAWRDKLPAIDKNGCLVAVVDGGRDFEVIVEVLRCIPFANTTFEVSMQGVRLYRYTVSLRRCYRSKKYIQIREPGRMVQPA